MRQIKFRAWDYNVLSERYEMRQWDQIKTNCMAYFAEPEKYNNRQTIMQFTGLYDKNGKEIYEGDVVNNPVWGYPLEIIYDNTRARFVCKLKSGLTITIAGELLTVIGNIYENPDLV